MGTNVTSQSFYIYLICMFASHIVSLEYDSKGYNPQILGGTWISDILRGKKTAKSNFVICFDTAFCLQIISIWKKSDGPWLDTSNLWRQALQI